MIRLNGENIHSPNIYCQQQIFLKVKSAHVLVAHPLFADDSVDLPLVPIHTERRYAALFLPPIFPGHCFRLIPAPGSPPAAGRLRGFCFSGSAEQSLQPD